MKSGPVGRRLWARMETAVVLRAAAILLVIGGHMTDVIPAGGAHLLFALAGFMFARFLLFEGADRSWPRRAFGAAARIGVPSMVWIGLAMLTVGGYGLGVLTLVNNYTGDPGLRDGDWQYWFIEALLQVLIVAAVLFSFPAVRRWERSWPFGFPLALLAGALVFRFDVVSIGDPTRYIFRPHTVVWLFLLGWLIQRAHGVRRRLFVTLAVAACVPGFFGEPPREAIIAAGLIAVIWLPTLPTPRFAARIVAPIAAASLFIYLTHWQIWPALPQRLPVLAAMAICVLAGIGIQHVRDQAGAQLARVGGRLRASRNRRTTAGTRAERSVGPANAGG